MNYISKRKTVIKFIILLVILILNIRLWADRGTDERTEPIDLVIALDISKSMEEEIGAVKEYIIDNIITDRLIIGDYFLVIGFYKESEVVTAGIIKSEEDKEKMRQDISTVRANGSWTDIGSMFDRIRDEFVERKDNNRKKRFLIMTDSINEPPPGSPYYTKSGELKHEYIEKIDDLYNFPGWKIQILAIGADPGGNVFKEDITGEYSEVDEDATLEDIEDALGEVIGEIDIVKDKLKNFILRSTGKGTLILPVTTTLFDENPTLIIDSITFTTQNFSLDILPDEFRQVLPADSLKEAQSEGKDEDSAVLYLKIPVQTSKKLDPGDYSGNIAFTFDSEARFASPLHTTVHVNNIWEDNPWLLVLIIVIAIIIIGILVVGIIKLIQGHPIKFKLLVDEMPLPKGKDTFKISRGKKLYLLESMDFIRVTDKKNLKCFAHLSVVNEDLKLHILKEKNFSDPKEIPENILEATIPVLTESGKLYHITFSEIT